MNIKSLLLGSAAALVAVSGARAADAVVIAEPEPVEYVRVCDVYGAGFYYLPGSETCLSISGYMQYDIGVGDLFGQTSWDKKDFVELGILDENDTYYKRARFNLKFDARTETELGTLRGFSEVNFNYATGTTVDGFSSTATSFGLEQAYIELGGFRIGKATTLFETGTGAAGNVINDDLIDYGTFKTMQIAYTFTGGNGFSASLALEEGDGVDYTIDSYVPHVVGAASFTQGWGGVSAVVAYDSVWEEWAGRVRLDVKASDTISLFVMGGYKSDELTPNNYGRWGGDWAIWGGGTAKLSERAEFNIQLSYDEFEDFAVVANVDYTVAAGFHITPEIGYYDNFDDALGDDDGEFGGYLRFRRSF